MIRRGREEEGERDSQSDNRGPCTDCRGSEEEAGTRENSNSSRKGTPSIEKGSMETVVKIEVVDSDTSTPIVHTHAIAAVHGGMHTTCWLFAVQTTNCPCSDWLALNFGWRWGTLVLA
jgi:hypothetical protein